MTDRELLELASKSNGGLVYVEDMGWIFEDENGNRGKWWNPLTNDGDALRLSVKLGFCISINRGAEKIVIETGSDDENHFFVHEYEWDDENSHIEATRRAIVGAAAEIGKAMP